jgi:c-di-GMP-binding flagellar brake protein YcgR
VEVTCEVKGGTAIQGRSRDISIGGMFIESETPVSFGLDVVVHIRLPNTKAESLLPGTVGLLGARETHAISELL